MAQLQSGVPSSLSTDMLAAVMTAHMHDERHTAGITALQAGAREERAKKRTRVERPATLTQASSRAAVNTWYSC